MGVITFAQLRDWIKNSSPFRARQPKRPADGLSLVAGRHYSDARSLGDVLSSPG